MLQLRPILRPEGRSEMSTRYRDLQAPVAVDTALLESGGSEAAASLARSLKSFEGATLEPVARLRAQQGLTEGAEAGLSAAFKPKTGLGSTTAYGSAYNSAGGAAYVAQTTTDIEASLDKYEQEHPGDPDTFGSKVSGYAAGLLKSAPREFQPRLQQLIADRTAAGVTRLRGQQLNEIASSQIADYEKGAGASAKLALKSLRDGLDGDVTLAGAVQDNQAQLDALVRDNVLSPLQAEHYRAKFSETLDNALAGAKLADAVEGLMATARGDVEEGDRALVALRERADLDSADKIFIAEEYAKQRRGLEFERSRLYVGETAALAGELAGGGHGTQIESAARQLYKQGALSPDEFESVLAQSARNEAKAIEDGADIATVTASLQMGRGIDPADTKQRAALDKLFNAETARLGESAGSDRWQAHAVELARASNVLPATAASWSRINLTSGDPTAASVAAGFLKRVQDANPVSWPFNDDPRVGAMAEKLNSNLAAGLPPEKAYPLAMSSTYLLTDAQRKELQTRYTSDKVARGNGDALDNLLSGDDAYDPSAFTSVPDVPMALRAEFGGLVEQYYNAAGGNVEQARALAFKAIKSTWALSTVNGEREVMKYAPERLGLGADIVREDIAQSVAPLGVNAASVKLVPNAATDRTRGQVWSLGVENEYGAVDVVLGQNNRPLLYQLPLGDAFHKTRDVLKARKVDEARRQRAFEQENSDAATDLEVRLEEFRRTHSNDATLRR